MENFTRTGIPKIIHQIWINENNMAFPEEWKKSEGEWKKHHPDFQYILWNKDTAINFVKEYFPQYFLTYTNLPYTIQRCDMLRYMFLYKYGGIYCDLDNYPKENLEKYFDTDYNFYVVEHNCEFFTSLDINLIVAKKELSICLDILKDIEKGSKKNYLTKFEAVDNTNGINTIKKYLKNYKYVYALPYQFFKPCTSLSKNCKDDDNTVLASTKSGSWHDESVNVVSFFYQYTYYIIFVIIVVVLLIVALVYYLNHTEKKIIIKKNG